MFNLLRTAMTLLICVLIVGFYLGWFSFSRSAPDPRSDKVNINVTVDKTKVRSDLQSAEQTISKRLKDMNSPSQPGGTTPPPGQQPGPPRLNLGPVSVEPNFQFGTPSNTQPRYQPQPPPPPDYPNTAPLVLPPTGER